MRRDCVTPWLLAVAFLLVFDDTYSKCTQSGSIFNVTVVCSDITDLSDLNELSSRINTLDLSNRNNEFKDISGDMFKNFPRLETLSLRNCRVKSINPSAFSKLRSLTKLDLSGNQLTSLTSELFDSLVRLEHLDLSYNQFGSFDDFIFQHDARLESVNLANCGLTDVSKFFKGGKAYLSSLDLSNNFLTSLDFLGDKEFNLLKSLNLAGNKISSTKDSPFGKLGALRILDIRNNQITNIEKKFFEGLSWDTALYLDGNQLTKVPKEALQSIELKELTLSGNPIDVLDSKSFPTAGAFCTNIEILKICDMPSLRKIGNHTFSQMRFLETLHVNRNHKLTSFSPRALDGLVRLSELKLEDNGLKTLDIPSIELDNVDVLGLSNNEWNCDCQLKWMQQLKNKPNFRCHEPSDLKGRPFRSVSSVDLCSEHHKRRLAAVLGTIFGIVAGVLIFVIIFRYKKNFKRCKRDPSNPYQTVATYDQEDGPRANIVMNCANEKAVLTEAVDV